MTSENTSDNLNLGRGWLNRAASAVIAGQDSPPAAVQFAHAAAIIGNGFIALAHAERAMRSSATLDAAAERVRRAAAEARPHDDERCACCASGIIPVFEGPKCVRGLGPDGCGHSHAEHAGYDRG